MAFSQKWLIVLMSLILISLMVIPETSSIQNLTSDRDYWPNMSWRGVIPEVQGMNLTMLEEFWSLIRIEGGVQGFLVIRNGYLLYEGYGGSSSVSQLWRIYSITKSVTAMAFGLAVADGYVTDLNETVLSYFPDRPIQNPDSRKSNMTLWHLLTMSSGLERSDFGMGTNPDWVQYLLDSPMDHEPGEFWNYNGGCSHLLSAIITETMGISMETLVHNRLFTPMGISRYEWGADPQGVTTGMAGLSLTLRDLAKLGYLFLNNGSWNGMQLLPDEWVTECTYPFFVFNYGEGYGYQWWIDIPVNGYSMRGAGGMRLFVLPEQDLILVFGAAPYGSEDYYTYFDDFIYPAIIGDTVSLLNPTDEFILLGLASVLILSVVVVSVVIYWRRKTS